MVAKEIKYTFKPGPMKIILVVKDNATSQLYRVSEHAFRIHTRFRLADEARTHRKYLGELFGWVPETTYICSLCGHGKDRANGCYKSYTGNASACVECMNTIRSEAKIISKLFGDSAYDSFTWH